MLELFSSGLISAWLQMSGIDRVGINATAMLAWQGGWPGLTTMGEGPLTNADPKLATAVQKYLQQLSQQGLIEGTQGVWIQAGMTPMVSHEGTVPMPGASLTKVATSLAALQTWSPNYQFETQLRVTGPIKNGVVWGNLVVEGGADPLFVWEEAIALGNALNKLGIKRIEGNLIVAGKFWMNYETDPAVTGEFLRQGMESASWSSEISNLYYKMPPGTPKPNVVITGPVVTTKAIPGGRLLLKRRSLPLAEILKQMNIYSDNEMAEMIADALGGAKTVQQQAAWAAGVPQSEIQLVNGSGLGEENRVSPRAVCAMFQALQRLLQTTPLTVADLFPVSGRDKGTLERRHVPKGTVAKTGTLDRVIALAGVLPTQEQGLVWFAFINRGSDWDGLRREQDVFLQKLVKQWGVTPKVPIAVVPHINGDRPALGAANRNDILLGG